MMKFKRSIWLAICSTVLLVGCKVDINNSGKQKPDADINPELYKCNESQLRLVKTEFEICSQSGYFNNYCFAQAKKSQCEVIPQETESIDN